MKISLKTIRGLNRRYGCCDDILKNGVDQLIGKIDSQLGAVEEIIYLGKKYHAILIVKVMECQKIANTDRLSVCKIDDGGMFEALERDEKGYVQVVCGAPNVRQGMLVAWIPPGSVVPQTVNKDPLKMEVREIRGYKSYGMLASPKELSLGDNHQGILEIDGQHTLGASFAETFRLKDDVVLDIENKMFTHRPDCFGFLGVSREIAGIQGMPFKSPDWYIPNPTFPPIISAPLNLTVNNKLPKLVPRFTAIAMRNVRVGPSPVWLQVELAKVGLKSINNIVDYSNFFMLETGQPLHAFDYDKVKAVSGNGSAKIVIRGPLNGEKLKLLNGKTIMPLISDIMIATDKQLIGLGGVMGGVETQVEAGTTNIILECATFDMYAIRRTSMAHGLFTDATTRFTKGQSPLQNLAVLAKIVEEIEKFAGGEIASALVDDNKLDPAVLDRHSIFPPVSVSADFINKRLGLRLKATDMKTLLQNVEFNVEIRDNSLTVKAPFWRTDIELREDVVEEVGRLYGYDKLPLLLPQRDLTPVPKDELFELKSVIRDKLARAGANEVLSYSFVPGKLLDRVGQDRAKAFQLSNALSPELQYYRISLMPSLLDKVHQNIKAGFDEFAIFELGKTHDLDHFDKAGIPLAFEFTALLVSANDKLNKVGAAYYQARLYLQELVGPSRLEFTPVSKDMQHFPVVQPYDLNRTALVSLSSGEFLGIIGEFKANVMRSFKLPAYTAGFELDTKALQKVLFSAPRYVSLSRYPSVHQDITLKVPVKLNFDEVFTFIEKALKSQAPPETHTRLAPVDIYQKELDPNLKNITLRLSITGFNRTLTDIEVNKLLNSIADAAKIKLHAERI